MAFLYSERWCLITTKRRTRNKETNKHYLKFKGCSSIFMVPLSYFSYHPPSGTDVEDVVVREMLNANDPVKNIILSMSDLHLDSDWSTNINGRLYKFMTKLASVAKVSNV